jgi:CBS domain containing-hemolysin-like protein
MTDIGQVECLTADTVMNADAFKRIKQIGFSRIPVVRTDNHKQIVGILMAKSLIGVSPSEYTIRDLCIREEIEIKVPLYFSEDDGLTNVMKQFKQGYSHCAIVCKNEKDAQVLRDLSDKVLSKINNARISYKESGEMPDYSNL